MSNPSIAGPNASREAREDGGPALLGVIVAFTAVATAAVILRLTVRIQILKSPGWDDAAISLALVLAIVSTTAYGIAIDNGYGRHIQTIPKASLGESIKWNLVATVCFYLSLIFSKVSICALFLRIMGKTSTLPKTAFLYSMMALALIIGIITAGYTSGQCQPVAKDWDHDIPGKCHGDVSMRIANAQGALNAFIDFALAAFPLTFLTHSAISLQRKYLIISLMSCGVIAGFCSIARVVASTLLLSTGDFTYDEVAGTYLAVTEEAVSIVVACAPTLLPLVRVIKGKRAFSTKASSYGYAKTWPTQTSSSEGGGRDVRDVGDPYEMGAFAAVGGREAVKERGAMAEKDIVGLKALSDAAEMKGMGSAAVIKKGTRLEREERKLSDPSKPGTEMGVFTRVQAGSPIRREVEKDDARLLPELRNARRIDMKAYGVMV